MTEQSNSTNTGHIGLYAKSHLNLLIGTMTEANTSGQDTDM